jgi:hypothetical protein
MESQAARCFRHAQSLFAESRLKVRDSKKINCEHPDAELLARQLLNKYYS